MSPAVYGERTGRLLQQYAGAPESLQWLLDSSAGNSLQQRDLSPPLNILERRDLKDAIAAMREQIQRVGSALFPVVSSDPERPSLLLRAIVCTTPQAHLTEALHPVHTRLHATLTLLGLSPLGLRYFYSAPPGKGWDGRSCELAFIAAAVSHLIDTRVCESIVFTGIIANDSAQIRAASRLREKESLARAVLGEHAQLHGPTRAPRPLVEVLGEVFGEAWLEELLGPTHPTVVLAQMRAAALRRDRPEIVRLVSHISAKNRLGFQSLERTMRSDLERATRSGYSPPDFIDLIDAWMSAQRCC